MKKLGVIGGLGPIATVYFLQLVTQMNLAQVDQEHIEILMHSAPYIPDRTGFILDPTKENPLPEMVRIGQELVGMGAQILAIPCITAHYFHDTLQEETGVPILHAIMDTAAYLKEEGINKVGLMATDGTLQSGLFSKHFQKEGIAVIEPEAEEQKGVMELIYGQVKAGKKADTRLFHHISETLFAKGAQVVLLGCTELSLIKREVDLGPGYLDVMEILAREAVKQCGTLRPEYERLLT